MSITTISDKRYMNDEHCIKHPMQMVELNVINSENPHLINSLDLSIGHPLISTHIIVRIKLQKMYVLNFSHECKSFPNCSINEKRRN